MHELRNRNASNGHLHEHIQPPFGFFCQVFFRVNLQNSKQTHTTKNFAKFPNQFPQLTIVALKRSSRNNTRVMLYRYIYGGTIKQQEVVGSQTHARVHA